MKKLILTLLLTMPSILFAQTPPIEPGVSQELAKWRAARYSDVRYKLNLTLEKMSPVLKGTMEIRVKVGAGTLLSPSPQSGEMPPIILDWRKIKNHEEKSTISNATLNGKQADFSRHSPRGDKSVPAPLEEINEHLVFRDGVVAGENVIKLDFTSPILTSGSAITRYVDKEDGSEYIYSLFVPSDASTAFPVFDQPDLKARFDLTIEHPESWNSVSNTRGRGFEEIRTDREDKLFGTEFLETKPISTYVFAFTAGPFEKFEDTGGNASVNERASGGGAVGTLPNGRVSARNSIYVRKSQAAKFKPHAAEVFRLNREAVKYFEQYFDYKFPFPKYDLVLIPEFPFGGMEHAGATFLRESSIIFPQEPTKNDLVSRATLIFHEAAHQWFGDTVTMRWFDDLWLKEGFATFTAYKAMEKIMPEMNAWKVFYERIKQGAYQTDSTKGTTPIYQEIKNLSAAKSAYGNIVYNKAPAFLRQAEFYLGEDKFQTAVRAFLKKHEFGNAGWEDLVGEFEEAYWKDFLYSGGRSLLGSRSREERLKHEKLYKDYIKAWARFWVNQRGLPIIRVANCFVPIQNSPTSPTDTQCTTSQVKSQGSDRDWEQKYKVLIGMKDGRRSEQLVSPPLDVFNLGAETQDLIFLNHKDYGYGIFLLDDKSRNYVLKNIQNEKDDFLRTMMWGSLWDSVREGELDPREYVELVVKVLSTNPSAAPTTPSAEAAATPPQAGGELRATTPNQGGESDESTIQTLLGRVSTAMTYYLGSAPTGGNASVNERALMPTRTARSLTVASLPVRLEALLIERMQNAPTLGQRITFYRAFLNIASTEKARTVLKQILKDGSTGGNASVNERAVVANTKDARSLTVAFLPVKTKDRFDIVTRLLILGDPDAPALLAGLEKIETSDEAKRYAYAAKAGIATAENKAKYWNDFTASKEISESWIEAGYGPFNAARHAELTLPYLERALKELPNHKRNRKIFFVNGWLGAFIGGQRSEEALAIVNKFLADNPNLDKDLRLKILENVDLIERAVRIRLKY